jgi:hypothetical protein
MRDDTAGDPMTSLKWTRKTTRKVASQLRRLGLRVSANTVARLLKQMGFSLRVNRKQIARSSPVNRDAQFKHIAGLRKRGVVARTPVISIDTKKKEMVGRFKNPGRTWTKAPVMVNDHDFRSDAKGMAVPYGIYDLQANRGTVFVGRSADTPDFAVDCVEACGVPKAVSATRRPGTSPFLPTVGAATGRSAEPGSSAYRLDSVTGTASV